MAKFRKKPVVIEAIKCSDLMDLAKKDWKSIPSWFADLYEHGALGHVGAVVFKPDGIYIPTLEGNMLASPDDMMIRGVKGEVYPCKPDIFDATYDRVELDAPAA